MNKREEKKLEKIIEQTLSDRKTTTGHKAQNMFEVAASFGAGFFNIPWILRVRMRFVAYTDSFVRSKWDEWESEIKK